jgi:nicotinate phosphoribosyltransferase
MQPQHARTGDQMIDFTATYTDQYQLTMAQVYFLKGHKDHTAVFDYFFRKLPFGGGYAIFAGLEVLLEVLEGLHFDGADLDYLKEQGFDAEFLRYLEGFRFRGNVYASREGDLVFPTRPVLQVEANIIEAQIVETLVLNILNFQTLIATKASRMRWVAGDRRLVDFGLRRAHGPGGYYASRAAFIGGFDATSNVRAGRDYGIPISGTMAHSFIESYDDELTAFRDFAEGRPDNCVLLVDTYDTIKSGVPNAITVAKEMEKRGHRLKGIRLDSGDLAWLAKKSRRMLDDAGLDHVKIAASNQLDEYVIKSLQEQQAPIDLYGVGTSLVVGLPDAALDGVYKLVHADGQPRIKLSESSTKTTIPHKKQVFRMIDARGEWIGADAVALADETDIRTMHHPFDPHRSLVVENFEKEPLLFKVMDSGVRSTPPRPLLEIAGFSRQRLGQLPLEYKRFENPHIYKVGLSDGLKKERDKLIRAHREG